MGRVCTQNGRSEFKKQVNIQERDLYVSVGVNGSTVLKLILKTNIDVNTRNWIDSVQDRDIWKAFVNAVLNLQVT
jgi:hypothetical protein